MPVAGRVRNKVAMFELYERGAFGNKLASWPSVDAFLADEHKPPDVGLRYAGASGGGLFEIVPAEEVAAAVERWRNEHGADLSRVRVNEAAPDHLITLQAELQFVPGIEVNGRAAGWVMRYNTEPDLRMREAMARARHAFGLAALLLLRRHLCPASIEDLRALWELYPTAVYELSAYSVNVGQVPGRNTLVWEVRDY